VAGTKRTTSRGRRLGTDYPWAELPYEQLLELRFRDLHLKLEGSEVDHHVQRLYAELERKGLSFRPHVWLSSEWFSPDATPGIAIPFYLAHPRLRKLEQRQMLEVEGGSEASCMRILRHEAGHAFDTAYRLHRRKRYRELFGPETAPYPQFYSPKPYSKSYVLHLDMWYAQAHPAEDFAETFAVWLRPGRRWRQTYKDWPAIKKLEYVDEVMAEIADQPPAFHPRFHVDPLREMKTTLRTHYLAKRVHYAAGRPEFFDADLRRLFSDDKKHAHRPTAASFLRGIRPDLRRLVARWTGEYQYTIDKVLDDIIKRCQQLRLRLTQSPQRTELDTIVLLTVQTMNYLHAGHHRVAL
jgi:hypothetical protein